MPNPDLPPQGNQSWYDHYAWLHQQATSVGATTDVTAALASKANASHTHGVTDLTATGSKSSTTFLRGDNTWAVPAGSGETELTASIKTASYTLVFADAGTAIEMNVATANTLTVPLNTAVPFPIGRVFEIVQIGAGQTTITQPGGVTLQTAASLSTRAQFSVLSLRKRATDTWLVSGDLA